jgi:proteasome-associated ATPase
MSSGRKMRVAVSPSIEVETLNPGQEVMLNETFNVVAVREYERSGEIV